MVTALTANAEVHSAAHDPPLVAAAGVFFFHLHHIAHL